MAQFYLFNKMIFHTDFDINKDNIHVAPTQTKKQDWYWLLKSNTSRFFDSVLQKINFVNGHFSEDKNVTFSNFANQYAFAMKQ